MRPEQPIVISSFSHGLPLSIHSSFPFPGETGHEHAAILPRLRRPSVPTTSGPAVARPPPSLPISTRLRPRRPWPRPHRPPPAAPTFSGDERLPPRPSPAVCPPRTPVGAPVAAASERIWAAASEDTSVCGGSVRACVGDLGEMVLTNGVHSSVAWPKMRSCTERSWLPQPILRSWRRS